MDYRQSLNPFFPENEAVYKWRQFLCLDNGYLGALRTLMKFYTSKLFRDLWVKYIQTAHHSPGIQQPWWEVGKGEEKWATSVDRWVISTYSNCGSTDAIDLKKLWNNTKQLLLEQDGVCLAHSWLGFGVWHPEYHQKWSLSIGVELSPEHCWMCPLWKQNKTPQNN